MNENVLPANFSTVSLKLNRTFVNQRIAAVPEILMSRILNDELPIQPNPGAGSQLNNSEPIPLTERFIGEDCRVLAGSSLAVIPQTAGPFVGSDAPLAAGFGVIPDLHLRVVLQVDATVSFRDGLVVDPQFVIRELFLRCEIVAVPVVDQITLLDGPVLDGLFPVGFVESVTILVRHLRKLVRIRLTVREPAPAVQILTIEKSLESFWRHVVFSAFVGGESRKCQRETQSAVNEESHAEVSLRGERPTRRIEPGLKLAGVAAKQIFVRHGELMSLCRARDLVE